MDRFEAVFEECGSARVIEAWEMFTWFRRSAQYSFKRHGVFHGPRYRGLLARSRPETEDSRLLAQRGRAQRLCGDDQRALDSLNRAVERDPRNAAARAWRWELLLGGRVPKSGLVWDDIDRAVSLEPRDPWWRSWRAIGRLVVAGRSQGDVRLMLQDTDAALRLAPDCVLAHLAAAEGFIIAGQRRKGLGHLDEAIRLDPRQYWSYFVRAQLRLRLGDHAGFLADCDAATLLDERVCFFNGAMAGSTRQSGDPRPRTPDLDGLKAPPELGGKGQEGRWLFALKSRADMRSPRSVALACERIVASQKSAYWIHVLRGNCRDLSAAREREGARRDFEAALAARPECSWAWAYLSRALMAEGRAQPALQAIGRAIALKPRCGWHRSWRGEMRLRLGDPGGALPDLDRGLRLSPDYDPAYGWRGEALRLLGRDEEALKDFDVAVPLDEGQARLRKQRALALRAVGRLDEVLQELQSALKVL